MRSNTMADGGMPPERPVSSALASTSAAHSSPIRDRGGPTTTFTAPSTSPVLSAWLRSRSPNVYFTLCFNFLDGAFYSMWAVQLLPVFLFETTSSITFVSLSATVSGVAQLLGALLAGCIADRQPRQHSIRVGAVCAMVALVVFVSAFWTVRVEVILCAQALWGLYTGIISTSVEALFADSVPQGHRTSIYNVKWIIQTACYVVGYGMAALLFLIWGNSWGMQRVRVAMTLGVVVHPLALVPLCFLRDRYAVDEEHDTLRSDSIRDSVNRGEAPAEEPAPTIVTTTAERDAAIEPHVNFSQEVTTQQQQPTSAASRSLTSRGRLWFTEAASSSASANAFIRETLDGNTGGIEEIPDTASRKLNREEAHGVPVNDASPLYQQPPNEVFASGETPESALWKRHTAPSVQHYRWRDWGGGLPLVPYWLYAADFLLAMGSGMSLPYFPLFFAIECRVSPASLNAIYIVSTLLTAAISSCLPWLIHSCGLGRVPTALFVRLLGTAALAIFATATTMPSLIMLFLCRNSLMNSVFGITRSVIMDCVHKESRAKWSALESVSFASWAGSAAIGGYITAHRGYRFNFVLTAALQFLASLLMIPAAFGEQALYAPLRDAPQLVENSNTAASSTAPSDTVKETRSKR
ncbi:hypothetical protein JKF63_06126 [Porcisia hertigi]|uniref:Uncharacterized protein n=1 Tax=Porcisia hertigi TaxID=2761500 RepID=A0A836IMT7_9TRYP|nr:hypothetical protein JKF63_06126 [Porcisia hertigi]